MLIIREYFLLLFSWPHGMHSMPDSTRFIYRTGVAGDTLLEHASEKLVPRTYRHMRRAVDPEDHEILPVAVHCTTSLTKLSEARHGRYRGTSRMFLWVRKTRPGVSHSNVHTTKPTDRFPCHLSVRAILLSPSRLCIAKTGMRGGLGWSDVGAQRKIERIRYHNNDHIRKVIACSTDPQYPYQASHRIHTRQ